MPITIRGQRYARYHIATLRAEATTNTEQKILSLYEYEYDDEGGSIAFFRVFPRHDCELSTGATHAEFDTLREAMQFAADEITSRLNGE